MKDKINILFIIDCLDKAGGTETHLARLVEHLSKERFKSYVVGFEIGHTPLIKQMETSGIPVISMPVGRYYTWNAVMKGIQLSRLIKSYKIDIVQTYHFKSDFYGTLVAWFSGIKMIISSKRDTGDLKSHWHFILNRLSNRLVTRFIAVADAVGKVVVEKEKVPASKITIIYNGVDTKKFHPPKKETRDALRKKMGFTPSDFIIGMVAWFRPEKNYDILFDAITKVNKILPDLRGIVVGEGPLQQVLKDYAIAKGISGIVQFSGETDDVRPFLEVMDVACLVPGSNEGFSNSILEKMATGLPMIVSDIGGNSEAVIDGYNGIVIPPNDSKVLAEAIIDLHNHADKRIEMGLNSRKRIEEKFSIEAMVREHEKFYENVMRTGAQ